MCGFNRNTLRQAIGVLTAEGLLKSSIAVLLIVTYWEWLIMTIPMAFGYKPV